MWLPKNPVVRIYNFKKNRDSEPKLLLHGHLDICKPCNFEIGMESSVVWILTHNQYLF